MYTKVSLSIKYDRKINPSNITFGHCVDLFIRKLSVPSMPNIGGIDNTNHLWPCQNSVGV